MKFIDPSSIIENNKDLVREAKFGQDHNPEEVKVTCLGGGGDTRIEKGWKTWMNENVLKNINTSGPYGVSLRYEVPVAVEIDGATVIAILGDGYGSAFLVGHHDIADDDRVDVDQIIGRIRGVIELLDLEHPNLELHELHRSIPDRALELHKMAEGLRADAIGELRS